MRTIWRWLRNLAAIGCFSIGGYCLTILLTEAWPYGVGYVHGYGISNPPKPSLVAAAIAAIGIGWLLWVGRAKN